MRKENENKTAHTVRLFPSPKLPPPGAEVEMKDKAYDEKEAFKQREARLRHILAELGF